MNATLRTFKPQPTFQMGWTTQPTTRQQAAQALRLYRASRRYLVSKNGHEYAIGRNAPFMVITTR